ncbi:hypothetical protein MMC20_004891 [Loxospora ochrophaea]|nr:hypothetical protein [Loxospora ochrophaea]
MASGPVVIYLVRLALSTYYTWRTSKFEKHLRGLQDQRDTTIDKLKAATKYNTTQQLLEKYGGKPPSKAKTSGTATRKAQDQSKQHTAQGGRTGFAPPATANIPRNNASASAPNTPQRSTPLPGVLLNRSPPHSAAARTAPWQQTPTPLEETAEFAPNAFSSAPQYAQIGEGPKWYDRLMDVLLGEDETLPKSRLALICRECRLVNGQAPPGIKRLEDVGKWRCAGCGFMNGEESEAKKIVAEIKDQGGSSEVSHSKTVKLPESISPAGSAEKTPLVSDPDGHESDVTIYSGDEGDGRNDDSDIHERALEATQAQDVPRPKSGT